MYRNFKKDVFIDVHKKALNIELQDITIFAIILRTLPDKTVYPLYAQVCAFASAAGVAIVNKSFLKKWIEFVDD